MVNILKKGIIFLMSLDVTRPFIIVCETCVFESDFNLGNTLLRNLYFIDLSLEFYKNIF